MVTVADILQKEIQVFPSTIKSRQHAQKLSVAQLIDLIKTGGSPEHAQLIQSAIKSGKNNPNVGGLESNGQFIGSEQHGHTIKLSKKVGDVWGHTEKKINHFQWVKTTQCKVATYNALFNETRSIKNVSEATGFMFLDFDDFSKLKISHDSKLSESEVKELKIQHALNLIQQVTTVVACWRSFSGNGIGALIYLKELTKETFYPNWCYQADYFQKMGLVVDPATKDLTRINVIPYDPNIYVVSEKRFFPTTAHKLTEEKITTLLSGAKVDVSDYEITNGVLESIFQKYFHENINHYERRISYEFYKMFAIKCNNFGVSKGTALKFLDKIKQNQDKQDYYDYLFDTTRSREDVFIIFDKIYETYTDKHNTIQTTEGKFLLIDFNKAYPLDMANIKFEEILFNCRNISGWSNKLKFIAKKANNVGIKKSNLESLLENSVKADIIEEEVDIHKVLKDAYGKLSFGFRYVASPQYTKEKRDELIEKYGGVERVNFIDVPCEDNTDRLIAIKKKVENYFQKQQHEQRTKEWYFPKYEKIAVLKKFVIEAITYNIPNEEVLEFMSTNFEQYQHCIDSYVNFFRDDFYVNCFYEYMRGLRQKPQTEKKNEIKIDKTILLKDGEKISDLELEDIVPFPFVQLIGKPNMGKTYAMLNCLIGKVILVCPNTAAVDNAATQYNIQRVREGYVATDLNADKFVCTSDSLKKLVDDLKNNGVDLKKITLVIDEAHTLATSTNKNYKNKVLNDVMDKTHLFLRVIFMTGTPFRISHPLLDYIHTVKIEWENPPITHAQIVAYKDKFIALENKLTLKDVDGGVQVIYFQNKKEHGGLGELLDFLVDKGWNKHDIQLVNSTEKHEELFKELLNVELIRPNIKLVICTSLISEAINIQNTNVSAIHFLSFDHPILLEQTVNRMRKGTPFTYIYNNFKKVSEFEDDNLPLNVDALQIRKIAEIEDFIERLPRRRNEMLETYYGVNFCNHPYMRINFLGNRVIDYLSIANYAFEIDKNNYRKNRELFVNTMTNDYDWQFIPDDNDDGKMENELKRKIKDLKGEKLDAYKDATTQILATIKSEGEIATKHNISDGVKRKYIQMDNHLEQIDLREKYLVVFNYLTWDDTHDFMLRWITDGNLNDGFFSKSLKQFKQQLFLKSNFDYVDFTANKCAKSFLTFYNDTFKKNAKRTFTIAELQTVVSNRKRLYDDLKDVDVARDTLKVLEAYFEVLPSISEDGVVLYRLGGLNVKAEMCIFNNRLSTYMQQKFDTGENINPEKTCHDFNKMREDLPILKYDKFTPYSVATLLTTFYNVKKWQEKKSHVYKIVSLTPKETSGFTVKERVTKPFMLEENWTHLVGELLKKDSGIGNTYIIPNSTKKFPNITLFA